MNIDIDCIVSASELSLDVSCIKERLETQDVIVVFDNNLPQFIITSIQNLEPTKAPAMKTALKIGEYVQKNIKNLFMENIITEEEIKKLCSLEYSKSVFKISFPVLKELDRRQELDKQKQDANGYNRYYNFILSAYGKEYLLCSQWLDKHYNNFDTWLKTIRRNHE